MQPNAPVIMTWSIPLRDYYGAIKNILGANGIIVPLGDRANEAGDYTTVTTVGQGAYVFTYRPGARSGWTDPQAELMGRGRIPRLSFNGTSEYIDTPDITFFSRGDGASDSVVSWGAWVYLLPAPGDDDTIFAKASEWLFEIRTSPFPIRCVLTDASAAVNPLRLHDTGMNVQKWNFVVATYDGGGGATAANGIILYLNGVAVASTATNNASYVAMENLTNLPTIGARSGGGSKWFKGSMAGGPLGPFYTQKQLSAAEILALHALGREALAPLGSDLRWILRR